MQPSLKLRCCLFFCLGAPEQMADAVFSTMAYNNLGVSGILCGNERLYSDGLRCPFLILFKEKIYVSWRWLVGLYQ
jgi:hypothetical protein